MNGTRLRGAQVMTMAPKRPDVERIDIPIDDDRIVEIGEHVDGPDTEAVDLSDQLRESGNRLLSEMGSPCR